MMLLLLFGILVAAIYVLCRNINKLKGLPPGPSPLPLLGNILSLDSDMQKVLLEMKKQYGGIFTVWLPQPHVVLCDYELIKDSIVRDGDLYSARAPPEEAMKLLVGGNYGLILNDNSMWREQRRFALHSLRDQGFGTGTMQDIITFLAHRTVEEIKKTNGEPIELSPYITNAVGNVISSLVFGKVRPHDDPSLLRFKKTSDELFEASSTPWFLAIEFIPKLIEWDKYFNFGFKRIQELFKQILDYLDEEIQEREREIDYDVPPKCYVDAYLHEMHMRVEKSEELGSFTRHQLVIAVFDMYSAGLETTVTTLRFLINYFLNYPDVHAKIIDEIDRTIGKRDPRMDDLKVLPYVNAVIQELHRLSNILPVNFARKLEAPTTLKGIAVVPQFQSVHVDSGIYERPDYFCPERHLNEKGDFVKDPRITPFSIGKRSCLGEPLANMEIFLFMVVFIQHFRFEPANLIPPALEVVGGVLRAPKLFNVRAVYRA